MVLKGLPFISLNFVAFFKEIIQQLSLLEIENVEEVKEAQEPVADSKTIRLTRLMALDPVEVDRRVGVCSIPLYDFLEDEFEIFKERDIEQVQDILKRHGIFQYFFPSPDHLALGLIENNKAPARMILDNLVCVPEMGHPFGQPELGSLNVKVGEIISALKEQKLVVDGDIGLELTMPGTTLRANVRYKPREGLFAKIANIISIKLNIDWSLKDLFK